MRLLTAVSLVRVQQGEFFHIRLLGQAVKTSPFHGGNTGSIPVGVIYKKASVFPGICEIISMDEVIKFVRLESMMG